MKKLLVAFLLGCIILAGCSDKNQKTTKTDYSKYTFTNVSWTRDTGHDKETLRFNSNGTLSYFCACGNPVNDSDICESYSYDDVTKEIKLNFIQTTDETITDIKIIKESEDIIELDFDGESRIFTKEK